MAKGKRYIVTFEETDVSEASAAKTLGVARGRLQEGVRHLETAEVLDDKDVLHFREIGSTVALLSSKEADDLRKKSGVAEVTEDFEVYALGCGHTDGEGNEGAGSMSGYPRVYWADEKPDEPPVGGQAIGATDSCPPGYREVCFEFAPWFPPLCFCLPVPPQPPAPQPRQPIGWNISMVKADEVWHRTTGKGVKVAVLDTGIDDNHPDLTVSGGASMVPGVSGWDDDQGHGTHCAGTIAARHNTAGVVGVAPDASLYAVKVLNSAGSGYLSWILGGMGWAEQNGMDVVSMSLGGPVPTADTPCTIAYQRAAERLIRAGCIVVAAAGNDGASSTPWVGRPARCPGFMAVAAVDRQGSLAYFSSNGPASLGHDCGVEISAPGVRVNSTTMGGGYGHKSGTSMACPHVSGAAALLKEYRPSWTPAQIRQRLRASASDLGAPGNDPKYGSGLLNCKKAIFG
jgi:subtilisin